nr:tripartite motif-containing 13 isoform X1 [Misgurnus anguillicaudatus]
MNTFAQNNRHKDTMELLEEDLTCPICCCLFEDPRVLPCSHSFCKKCLEGILDGNRSSAWRPPFKCPTCRKETAHNGIASLQVNYTLRGIVEKYNKIRVLPRMSLCRAHSGQPLNIFCATDLKLICGFCATTGDHKGHKFCALEEAYEREKVAFEELFRVVEGWRSAEVHLCLESLEGAKKKALERVSGDADRVSSYFDKLLRTLDHKRSEILSDFETLKLAVMQTFDPEINRLRSALEEQRCALAIAESFRSLSDPLTFLQQMQDFREKLSVIRETPLPSRTDLEVGLRGLQSFDLKEWDRVRFGEVDKLCAPYESSSYLTSLPPAPRYSRVLWRVLLVVFACLPALHFLPSDCLALSFHDKLVAVGGFTLPSPGEILRWFGFCWKEGAAICTLLIEQCRNSILDLINTTSDFIS